MGAYVDLVMKKFADAKKKIAKLEAESNEEVDIEANKYAAGKVTPLIEADITDVYESYVQNWYSDYTPKKYHRSDPHSLSKALRFEEDEDGIYSGWKYVDDDLNKPSLWGGGTFNIYNLVLMGGSHGGPIPWRNYIPKKSTSVAKAFDEHKKETQDKIIPAYRKHFREYGDEYFNTHAEERLIERIREKYGSEFDWLIG